MNKEIESQVVIYQDENGEVNVEVKIVEETVWLSLNQIAELFARDKSAISRHLKNIFKEGELEEKATVAFFATVQIEGERSVEMNCAPMFRPKKYKIERLLFL